ncbi:plasmid replication protein, CyRepA1 family [Okeania sp. KiyG1]|uniref:plasmid replication protein, CyRepA1 family n=1 Tax=Okeania sp. KiyG1 TaxID=2720165 RepID=UPI001F1B5ED1|nr:plasmid replication protein, CyRepA1 family [Okeania sp. KiyG1]
MEKTNHLLHGCWYIFIVTELGLVPHFKPDKPRITDDRKIKYEQIKGSRNGIFLPKITYGHVKLIAERFKVKNYPQGELNAYCEKAWNWIAANKKITIAITEGWKKTMALMSVGIPAIGLSGVWNFNNSSNDKTLIPTFYKFKGHNFCFYYDNDSKPKTIKHVNTAIIRLSTALLKERIAKATYRCHWSSTSSKGIDDYLYDHDGDEQHLLYEPITYGEKSEKIASDLVVNVQYLTNENLEAIPEVKKVIAENRIILMKSAKGCGKTEVIADYIYECQQSGTKTLAPIHRVQLMTELSGRFGIANANNYMKSLDKVFGLAVCTDSMHANSKTKFNPDHFNDSIVVIDEIEQVLWHTATAKTEVRKHRPEVINNVIKLIQNAGKFIGSDADLSAATVDLITEITGQKPFVIENKYKQKDGHCMIYTQGSPYKILEDFLKEADKGKNLMLFVTGQKASSLFSSINMETMLKARYPDEKIMRVDAETVADPERPEYEFFKDFDGNVDKHKPSILICTPVMETGINAKTKHFDSFWGLNWGNLTVDSFSQAAGRIREKIPRYIWSSNRPLNVAGNGSCFASQLIASAKQQHELNKAVISYKTNRGADDFEVFSNDSILRYWAKKGAIINAQGKVLRESVIAKFASDYEHLSINDEVVAKNVKMEISSLLKTTREANMNEFYSDVIAAEYVGDITFDKLSSQKEKNYQQRCCERKNKTIRKLSPVSRKSELSPEILEAEDRGDFYHIMLHWLLIQGLEIASNIDAERHQKGEFILDSNSKVSSSKIFYFEQFGIQEIINNPDNEYSNSHPLIKKVGANIRAGFNHLRELKVSIRDLWSLGGLIFESTDWVLVKWCLRLLGFDMRQSRRTGKKRYYYLVDKSKCPREKITKYWDEYIPAPREVQQLKLPDIEVGDLVGAKINDRFFDMCQVLEKIGDKLKVCWGLVDKKIFELGQDVVCKLWKRGPDGVYPAWSLNS